MAIDAFMAFIPDDNDLFPIEGESTDVIAQGVKGFEIIEFKWSASSRAENENGSENEQRDGSGDSASSVHGTGSGNLAARLIKVDSFSITKPIDKASLALFRACTTENCVFGKAKVIFRKLGKDRKPFVYLCFDFQKVRVDSIEWKLAPLTESTDKPEEEDIDFSFNQCNLFYTPQSSTGEMLKKTTKTASYSRITGKDEDAEEF